LTRILRGSLLGVLTVATVVGALGLTGCAAQSGSPSGERLTADQIRAAAKDFRADGNVWLAELLEDGEVTADDYERAARRYEECMQELGYEVPKPAVNPTDSMTYIYDIRPGSKSEATFSADQEGCLNPDLNFVEAAYLNTGVQRIDESLRIAAQACMAAQGYDIPDEANEIRAFSGDPATDQGAQRNAAATCLSDEALRMFPELPFVSVGY
jgi:hypothetical protein